MTDWGRKYPPTAKREREERIRDEKRQHERFNESTTRLQISDLIHDVINNSREITTWRRLVDPQALSN